MILSSRRDLEAVLGDYLALLKELDCWFARCSTRFGSLIACGAGCSACCRGLFDITLLDAWLLKTGFDRLPADVRSAAEAKSRARLRELQAAWPDFQAPYLLNGLPDEEWTEMPAEDPTPCPLLVDGRCLVYSFRPMICRLHGLPNIDHSGEDFAGSWCTLNFRDTQPLEIEELRWSFRRTFERELQLFRKFSAHLTGTTLNEADTFIPTALLIDFAAIDWAAVARNLSRSRSPG